MSLTILLSFSSGYPFDRYSSLKLNKPSNKSESLVIDIELKSSICRRQLDLEVYENLDDLLDCLEQKLFLVCKRSLSRVN